MNKNSRPITAESWHYYEEGSDMVFDHEDCYLAKVGGRNDDEIVSRCRLISAAPDLLYVLKCILKESDKLHEAHFQLAVAAIEKAEPSKGEEK